MKQLEAKLNEKNTKISDLSAGTNWLGVLEELGFTNLESGRLLKVIEERHPERLDLMKRVAELEKRVLELEKKKNKSEDIKIFSKILFSKILKSNFFSEKILSTQS